MSYRTQSSRDTYSEEFYADHSHYGDCSHLGEEEHKVSDTVDGCHEQRVADHHHEGRAGGFTEAVTVDGYRQDCGNREIWRKLGEYIKFKYI